MAQADKNARGVFTVDIGDISVAMNDPTEGQRATLRRVVKLLQSGDRAAVATGCGLFLDISDTLVVDNASLDAVYEGMATEKLQLEHYVDGIVEGIKHFLPDAGDEPVPANRATRRARAGTAAAKGGRR